MEWAVCVNHLRTQGVGIECGGKEEELEKKKEEKLKEEQEVMGRIDRQLY
jgi:hypothetical protein